MPTWVAGVASLEASIPCHLPLLCPHHCWLHKDRLRAVLIQEEGIGTGGDDDDVGNADPGGGCDDGDGHADNTCMARPGK